MTDAMRRGPLVLIVEDDGGHSEFLDREFSSRGWAVVTAFDGWQALDLARRHRPELVVLEVDLPHDSGIWFYRARHRWPELRSVPLIVLTRMELGGTDPAATFARAMEREGMSAPQAYLQKPLTRDDLHRAISSLDGLPLRGDGRMSSSRVREEA